MTTQRIRSSSFRAAVVAATFALATFPAAVRPASAAAALPIGTTISGNLNKDLDTAHAQVGDSFRLYVTSPYPNGDPSFSGATIRGHVASVRKASQGRTAELGLAFDSIVMRGGRSAPITGSVTSVQKKQKSAILQQAAGAGVGMIVGNIIGKKLGTGLGGIVGAGGGFAYGNNLKTNFDLPKNSTVVMQTTREVPRLQARR